MKILQLQLLAFGPFTNEILDLSTGDEGLHLIFGANEAGKSSALHALTNLLYGIPQQNDDDFVHSYQNMRIGAVLRDAGGDVLECIRRKARAQTLRGADDVTVVDEERLKHFLAGVDESTFSRRFGISYDALVAGGREIVEGGGELGKSLFAAASGVADLNAVQKRLQDDANELFLPSGKNPTINAGLRQFKVSQKAIAEASLPHEEYDRHIIALEQAKADRQSVARQMEEMETIKARRERLHKAIPLAAQRRQLRDELAPLTDVPLLPPDFSETRRQTVSDVDRLQAAARNAQQEIVAIKKQLDELESSTEYLERASQIEKLHKDLGSYEKALADRQGLLRERDGKLADAGEHLANLGRAELSLEDVESLRLSVDQKAHVHDLGAQKQSLVDRATSAQTALANATKEAEEVCQHLAQLPPPRDPAKLTAATRAARAEGDVDSRLKSAEEEAQRIAGMADQQLATLGRWSGDLATACRLATPQEATIDRFEQQFDKHDRDTSRRAERLEQLQSDLAGCVEKLEHLRHQQEVPTEAGLADARRLRDRGWQLIVKTLAGESVDDGQVAEVFAGQSLAELPSAYKKAVEDADEIADRLRREADRVAEQAQLVATRDKCQSLIEKEHNDAAKAQSAGESLESQWRQNWAAAGIRPDTPREMRAWLRKLEQLQESAQKLADAELVRNDCRDRAQAHRQSLREALQDAGEGIPGEQESMTVLLDQCERVADEITDSVRERETADAKLTSLKQEVAEGESQLALATDDLKKWADDWKDATQPLRLREEAAPSEANVVLATIDGLLADLKDSRTLDKRIAGIDRDSAKFESDMRPLVDELAPMLADASVSQAVAALNDRLARKREARAKEVEFLASLTKQQEKKKQADEELVGVQSQLAQLCREAGCENHEELPGIERQSNSRRELENLLRACQQQLTELAAGQSLEEFVAEVDACDAVALQREIAESAGELEELDGRRSSLDKTIGREEGEIDRMDGSGAAAALHQQSQDTAARTLSAAREYARLRVASVVLGQAITRYRETSEGPVLRRASELFADLTLGSFEGLRADFDERGQAVLVGVRSGTAVGVGGMSDGTADQLYLALRLASLDHYLQTRPPLPFIVDDILVKFDDDRAVAALKALAALSQSTQVIMFTHHEHIVRLAKDTLDDDVLFTHQLDSRRMAAVADAAAV